MFVRILLTYFFGVFATRRQTDDQGTNVVIDHMSKPKPTQPMLTLVDRFGDAGYPKDLISWLGHLPFSPALLEHPAELPSSCGSVSPSSVGRSVGLELCILLHILQTWHVMM